MSELEAKAAALAQAQATELREFRQSEAEKRLSCEGQRILSLVSNNLLYKGPGERLAAMGPGLGRKLDK